MNSKLLHLMPIKVVPSYARYSFTRWTIRIATSCNAATHSVFETLVMEHAHGYEVSPAPKAHQIETEGA
jgi:hypothetical protein